VVRRRLLVAQEESDGMTERDIKRITASLEAALRRTLVAYGILPRRALEDRCENELEEEFMAPTPTDEDGELSLSRQMARDVVKSLRQKRPRSASSGISKRNSRPRRSP
jgi:hypothetical protein